MIAAMIISAASETAHSPAVMSIEWPVVWAWVRAGLSAASILMGLFFVFAGTIGVLRLPDFYTRIHAAGMTDTLGAEMILLGLIIQSGFSQMTLKLLMISFFLLLTSPTATHAVAHAAHKAGLKPKLGPQRAKTLDELRANDGGPS
jgi:multicomponent Na+:H+ antiporter subunit G